MDPLSKLPTDLAVRRYFWYALFMGLFKPAALSEQDSRELIEGKLTWILEACSPEEVWLFGSAARGDLTVASDIDMALVFNDQTEIGAARRALAAKGRPDSWPQDILYYTRDDFRRRSRIGGAAQIIAEEGRRLYPPSTE